MDAIRKIEEALAAGPTDGPWRAEELEANDGTFFPSFTTIPSGRFHHNPAVDADYIAACNPSAIREVLQTLASKDAEIAAMEAEIAVLRESRKFLSNMHHDIIVAMQAAWIEWQRVGDADTAMFWIQNTLAGPGLIPGEDEPYASEPQAYFDKNKSEPFPECFCGRPSNQLWMGQGFCSQAHYAEARAALTTQPNE